MKLPQLYTLAGAAHALGMSRQLLDYRIRHGLTVNFHPVLGADSALSFKVLTEDEVSRLKKIIEQEKAESSSS